MTYYLVAVVDWEDRPRILASGTLPLQVLLHWSEALDRKYQQEGKGGFED